MIKEIPYGMGTVALEGLPLDRFDAIRGKKFVSQTPEKEVFCEALDRPVSGKPLAERVGPGMTVAVVIPDRTRVCGSERFLPWVLERLTKNGLRESDIRIVFAVGTHTAQSEEDQRQLLGKGIWGKWRVVEPNCRDLASLVGVGTTGAGTEVFLNRQVVEADLVVACGAVIHHYFAGMGGGPKLIVPGVAGESTIFSNHRRAIGADGKFYPDCQDGKTHGNPLWEDMLEAATMAPPIYHVGIVLDDNNRIGKAFGGDLEPSHQAACEEVKRIHEVRIAEKRQIIIVSPGGRPRDINFIQSHKGLQHASYALADQGVMILVAECPDGLGSEHFMEWMKYRSAIEMAKELSKRYTLNGHTAMAHRRKLDWATEICVSDMNEELVRELGMIPAVSVKDAWEKAQELVPTNSKGYIMSNGFVDIPFYRKD